MMSAGRLASWSRVLVKQPIATSVLSLPSHQVVSPVAAAAANFSTSRCTNKVPDQSYKRRQMRADASRVSDIDDSNNSAENVAALKQAQLMEEVAAEAADEQASEEFKLYPDEDTFDTLYNGIKYKDLPYVYVRCTRNNTRMSAYQADGTPLHYTTPVLNGFMNSKKKTNVAAQATGLAMGQKLRTLNQRTVRVRIDGFNAGRIAVLTGLTQAGINVVSVSDVTYIDWFWAKRAQKRKRG